MMKTTTIVGGGLAGLICGIQLAKKGMPCTVLEKRKFPVHKVCGEYVSNESKAYLQSLGVFPNAGGPKEVYNFQLSSIRGHSATMPLDVGGFSISRFFFDSFLVDQARRAGVEVITECEVTDVSFIDDTFLVKTSRGEHRADIVLGAQGKRSRLDATLGRGFIQRRSPWVGVKYHIKTDLHPDGLIALHNFNGGYCGVLNVENDITNICYLTSREQFRVHKNIETFEEQVLHENPMLRKILTSGEAVFDKPLVINEVSFETKQPVENHILMTGDAAGMIAPLCGNGMAMAIHSGKIAANCIEEFIAGRLSRVAMEETYRRKWRKAFSARLAAGRTIQKLFGSRFVSELAVRLILSSRILSRGIMKYTHGQPF